MDEVFNKYAKYYDILYSDKNYEYECDFLEDIFKNFLLNKPKNILDVGCGTGGYTIPLLMRGYNVEGFDISEEMIRYAFKKIKKEKLSANLYVLNINNFKLNQKYDSVICMFAVMNYLNTTVELIQSMHNIRKHLKINGLFIFDFWYGPAVLHIKPSIRVKEMTRNGIKVMRIVRPKLDINNHICNVNYHLMAFKDNVLLDEFKETHTLRYLFSKEIELILNDTGFELLKLCEFPTLNKPPSENTWNVAAIAKAV